MYVTTNFLMLWYKQITCESTMPNALHRKNINKNGFCDTKTMLTMLLLKHAVPIKTCEFLNFCSMQEFNYNIQQNATTTSKRFCMFAFGTSLKHIILTCKILFTLMI